MHNDNKIKIEIKSLEEMKMPSILYKYRNWDDDTHKRILTHNELYLASPADFEDKRDCKNPTRYDFLTKKEVIELYYKYSKDENPNFNRQQNLQWAKDCESKGLLRNKKHLDKQNETLSNEFHKRFGVLSLTAIRDNYHMWKKYANNFKGFCIGFKCIPLCDLSQYFGSGGEVLYYETLPIIKATDSDLKQETGQIYAKLKKWEHEKEYRLTKFKKEWFNTENRKAKIPPCIYTEIILGANMSVKSKDEIISIANKKFPEVEILKAELNNNSVIISKI